MQYKLVRALSKKNIILIYIFQLLYARYMQGTYKSAEQISTNTK